MMILSIVLLPGNKQKSIVVGNNIDVTDVCHLPKKHVNMLCRLPENASVWEFSAS